MRADRLGGAAVQGIPASSCVTSLCVNRPPNICRYRHSLMLDRHQARTAVLRRPFHRQSSSFVVRHRHSPRSPPVSASSRRSEVFPLVFGLRPSPPVSALRSPRSPPSQLSPPALRQLSGFPWCLRSQRQAGRCPASQLSEDKAPFRSEVSGPPALRQLSEVLRAGLRGLRPFPWCLRQLSGRSPRSPRSGNSDTWFL